MSPRTLPVAPSGLDDLPARLTAVLAEIASLYARPDDAWPWVIGFSAGKDSTLLLHLVLEVLLAMPAERWVRPVYVVCNDTLVESPVFASHVDVCLAKVADCAEDFGLPVTVVRTRPRADDTFWVNLIGKGYPAPNRFFRWCTDHMKVRPTQRAIEDVVRRAGGGVLLLGVRRSESAQRARTAKKYDVAAAATSYGGGLLNEHDAMKGVYVYRPILAFSDDDVWAVLMQRRPPWGGTHRDLVTLYRNAKGGECPFVATKDEAPSCGTGSARFGCWTCTVVRKDKSLDGLVESGHDELAALSEFRDWLVAFSADPANRMAERRDGLPCRPRVDGTAGVGGLTYAARAEVLRRLLDAQDVVGVQLVSPDELALIRATWEAEPAAREAAKARRAAREAAKARRT